MIFKIFLGSAALLAALDAGAASTASAADRAVLAANDAFRRGNPMQLEKHADAMRGHVLEPYADYWRLRLQLEDATPNEVSAFFKQHAGTYVAEMMRADWLKVLGKRGEWGSFDAELGRLEEPDPEIRCYALAARLARGDDTAVGAFTASLWKESGSLPEGCARLADQLIDADRLTVTDIWARVRVLFEYGQIAEAKRVLGLLPRGEAANERDLLAAARHPRRLLSRKPLRLETRAAREVVVLAAVRLARDDAPAAAEVMENGLADALPEADRKYVWGKMAQEASRQHDPQALEWFALADGSPLDDIQLAWKARAGLRRGNWQAVREAIDAMSEAGRRESAWTYWYGRALAAQGNRFGAQIRYFAIAEGTGFYNVLAAEELGDVQVPSEGYEPEEAEIEQARRRPGIARALELHRLGLREEAAREWIFAVRALDDGQLIAAAELARRAGAYERAINTAGRTTYVHNLRLRYVAPYRDVFEQQARAQSVDPAWLLAVARQESRFATEARSGAGARGLMQIMPATAKWIARRSGMRNYRNEHAHDVQTNITLGTRYLKGVLDRFGSPVVALAAYNAGPTRAQRWRDAEPLEGAVYAETIPFPETRDYVKKVMSSAVFYSVLLHDSFVPLKDRLGVVTGR